MAVRSRPAQRRRLRGASEIEVEFGGEEPFGTVVGTSRADEFHWNLGGTPPGLNLNPGSADDQDVDLAVTKGGILVGFYSRSGREAMTGSSRPPAGYFPAPALYFPPTSTRWVSEETISWSRPHPPGANWMEERATTFSPAVARLTTSMEGRETTASQGPVAAIAPVEAAAGTFSWAGRDPTASTPATPNATGSVAAQAGIALRPTQQTGYAPAK